jgi:hypothetical protein
MKETALGGPGVCPNPPISPEGESVDGSSGRVRTYETKLTASHVACYITEECAGCFQWHNQQSLRRVGGIRTLDPQAPSLVP